MVHFSAITNYFDFAELCDDKIAHENEMQACDCENVVDEST